MPGAVDSRSGARRHIGRSCGPSPAWRSTRAPAGATGGFEACPHALDDGRRAAPLAQRTRALVASSTTRRCSRPATPAEAVRAHARHRAAWYAGCVGPLLVPAAGVADLVAVLEDEDAVAGADGDAALDVVLVARPGADPAVLTAGVDALHDEPRVRVVGAELAWHEGWRELGLDDLAVALEVPRGDDHDVALADIRTAVHEGLRWSRSCAPAPRRRGRGPTRPRSPPSSC